jgi:hypothetical protein
MKRLVSVMPTSVSTFLAAWLRLLSFRFFPLLLLVK